MKRRDIFMGQMKPRAHVNDSSDDVQKQAPEQQKWNSNEDAIHEFMVSEGVFEVLRVE